MMATDFMQMKETAPALRPGIKIIKATDYAHYKSARELWEKCQEDIRRNEADAEALRLKSIEDGLAKGAEEAKARMASQMLNSASSLMTQLTDIEKDLTAVVLSAVRKIVSDFEDEKLVFEAVKKGLQPVYKSQRVAIRVHPEAIPALSTQIASLRHEIDFLEILPDEKLNSTDCVIESDIGIVNASIDAQLQAIEEAVKHKLASSLEEINPSQEAVRA